MTPFLKFYKTGSNHIEVSSTYFTTQVKGKRFFPYDPWRTISYDSILILTHVFVFRRGIVNKLYPRQSYPVHLPIVTVSPMALVRFKCTPEQEPTC